MPKSKKQTQGFDFISSDVDVTVNIKEVESKTNISSQNKDTGLASYNADDTRPYEQKNTSAGFHKSGMGTK